MALKAELKIVLRAGSVTVAESNDPELWQFALRAIQGGNGLAGELSVPGGPQIAEDVTGEVSTIAHVESSKSAHPLSEFADQLTVDRAVVEGACDPQVTEPFLHLDAYHWAAWRSNVPHRGRRSVSPTGLAGALLTLWFRAAQLGQPTVSQIRNVLNDLGVQDNNWARGIRNCQWLQLRSGDVVQLNPGLVEDVVEIARAFCLKRRPEARKNQ